MADNAIKNNLLSTVQFACNSVFNFLNRVAVDYPGIPIRNKLSVTVNTRRLKFLYNIFL